MSQELFKVGKRYSVTLVGQAISGTMLRVETNESFQKTRTHIFGDTIATNLSDVYEITKLPDLIPPRPLEGTLFLIKWNGTAGEEQKWTCHRGDVSDFLWVKYCARDASWSAKPELWSHNVSSPTWISWERFWQRGGYDIIETYVPV